MSTNRTLLHLQNLPTHRSHSFVKSAIFERGLCRDPKMTQVGHFWVAKTSGSLLGPGSSLGRPPQHSQRSGLMVGRPINDPDPKATQGLFLLQNWNRVELCWWKDDPVLTHDFEGKMVQERPTTSCCKQIAGIPHNLKTETCHGTLQYGTDPRHGSASG